MHLIAVAPENDNSWTGLTSATRETWIIPVMFYYALSVMSLKLVLVIYEELLLIVYIERHDEGLGRHGRPNSSGRFGMFIVYALFVSIA